MNLYARIRSTIMVTTQLARAFWLYSKPGNEQSFWKGYSNPFTREDVAVMIFACGEDCKMARSLIQEMKKRNG